MTHELKPPIILFGNTRSGTTIVQKVISTHPEVVDWYEPNALWLYADPARIHDEFDERDATDKVVQHIRKRFLKYQRKNGNRIVVEKNPKNILRVPYVRTIFPEAKFLYIIRDPFSFISSAELKWQRPIGGKGIVRYIHDMSLSQLHHWVRRYISQQYDKRILRKKYLSIWGPRYKGIQEDLQTHDLLTVIARQWSIPSKKAEEGMSSFENSRVLRLKYEDFVDDPVAEFERICSHCGLEMSNEMVKATREMVKSDRKHKWQRFDPGDLARILPEISEEMERNGYEIPDMISQANEFQPIEISHSELQRQTA